MYVCMSIGMLRCFYVHGYVLLSIVILIFPSVCLYLYSVQMLASFHVCLLRLIQLTGYLGFQLYWLDTLDVHSDMQNDMFVIITSQVVSSVPLLRGFISTFRC